MSIISTFLTVPGQPSPRFHVEAWLPFRNREMDDCKSPKVRMLNEWQVRTFIFNDNTCEIQFCVRACNLRTAFIDCERRACLPIVSEQKGQRQKENHLDSRVPVTIFTKARKQRKILQET